MIDLHVKRCVFAGALSLALLLPAISRSQVLVGDYQFQGNLNSSVAGAPALTAVGTTPTYTTGTTTDSNTMGLASFGDGSGGNHSSNAISGFALNASSLLSGYTGNYTIAVLYYNSTDAAGNGGWSPSIILGGTTSGAGSYMIGSSSAVYAPNSGGNVIGTGGGNRSQYNAWVMTASTASTTNPSMNLYVNGTLIMSPSIASSANHPTTDPATDWNLANYGANSGLLSFFASTNGDKDYNPNGEVARIEIYDGAMTTAQVDALDLTNEATAIPEPRTWATLLCGLGCLIGFRRRRSRGRG